jgi:hypothetical protein
MDVQFRDVLALKRDATGRGANRPGYQIEQGRLPCPIGTDDGVQLTGMEVQGNTVNGREATKAADNIPQLEQRPIDFTHAPALL